MSKCIRCGGEAYTSRICRSCMNDWKTMRSEVYNAIEAKYGKLCPENHPTFIKEMKRLERIWRKDKEKFAIELGKV